MRTPIFQVDAFTTRRFAGNPAAVMPMNSFPEDAVLQAIAAENNLAGSRGDLFAILFKGHALQGPATGRENRRIEPARV